MSSRAPAPPPAPARLAVPTYQPLVAAGPSEAELVEEAAWEQWASKHFATDAGPATRALEARGLPSLEQRRSDAWVAEQQVWSETFERNAEAHRRQLLSDADAALAATAARGDVQHSDPS